MSIPALPRPAVVERAAMLRFAGIAASLVAALLYLLIGLELLEIGKPANGSANDLLTFGVLMAVLSAGSAFLLWRVVARWSWIAILTVQLVALVGYVAVSGVREPPFELWGALIKVCQAVVVVAVAYLLAHHRELTSAWRTASATG